MGAIPLDGFETIVPKDVSIGRRNGYVTISGVCGRRYKIDPNDIKGLINHLMEYRRTALDYRERTSIESASPVQRAINEV